MDLSSSLSNGLVDQTHDAGASSPPPNPTHSRFNFEPCFESSSQHGSIRGTGQSLVHSIGRDTNAVAAIHLVDIVPTVGRRGFEVPRGNHRAMLICVFPKIKEDPAQGSRPRLAPLLPFSLAPCARRTTLCASSEFCSALRRPRPSRGDLPFPPARSGRTSRLCASALPP